MKKITYLLLAAIIAVLVSFQIQENQTFYYGFNEKIPLTEVENKLVVRFSESINKENASNALKSSHSNLSQSWQDERTVVLSTDSKVNRNKIIENLKKLPEIILCRPLYKINTGMEMILTDEFVVKFKENVRAEQQQEMNQRHGASIIKSTDTYQLLKVSKGGDVLDIANKYQESGLVEFSHPNFIVQIEKHQQVFPNDPFFVNQFTLNNTGQVFNDGHFGIADADIDAPECWAMTTGANNILIAVLDQGVSPNHPDLPNARQVRLNGSNFADGDPNDPSPTGNTNHGNACAGVIAATQNNNEGISGVSPGCRIMPIRIFNTDETGVASNRLVDAIDFARTNGADIISNSWGTNSDNPNAIPMIVTAIQTATTQGRGGLGCVVLFAAGNNARHTQGVNGFVSFPSNVNIPGVITVGASDRNDLQSDYSPTSNPESGNNQIIDIAAPSHRAYPPELYLRLGLTGGIAGETFEAWSIDVPGNAGYNPWPEFTSPGNRSVNPPAVGEQLPNAGVNFQAYTGRFGGTSHSCPVVAGVAALVLSANPNLTQQQVFDIITGTADRVGGYVYTNGRSNELGFGRVNACQAVREAYRQGMSIAGSLVCSSTTFTLQNAPLNLNLITWTSSNPNGLSINNSGQATRLNNFNGSVTITAWLNTGCGNSSVSKTVWVGPPYAGLALDGSTLCCDYWRYVEPGTHTLTVFRYGKDNNGQNTNVNIKSTRTMGGTTYSPTYYNSTADAVNYTWAIIHYGETYNFEITTSNTCGTWKGWATVTTDQNSPPALAAFPNPTDSEMTVQLEDDGELKNVVLYNSQQEIVYTKETKTKEIIIPTKNLNEGRYVLKIVRPDKGYSEHIIVRH